MVRQLFGRLAVVAVVGSRMSRQTFHTLYGSGNGLCGYDCRI